VALILGFRPSAGPQAWLAVAGILALFTLALTWCLGILVLAYSIAMRSYKLKAA